MMRVFFYCAFAAILEGVPLCAGEPLFPIHASGHFGFMGKTGKIVIEPKFIRVGRFSEGLAVVGVGYPDKTRYAFIDETGVMAIAPSFFNAATFSDGLAASGRPD